MLSACLMWARFVKWIKYIMEKPYLSTCLKCKSTQQEPKIGALYDLDWKDVGTLISFFYGFIRDSELRYN